VTDETPRLRDRNWFFHHLLSNGDQATYERERPRWKERRRREKQARRESAKLMSPELRKLQVQVEKDKKAMRACVSLTWWSHSTRMRIRHANKLRAKDAATTVDEAKIVKRLTTVRKRALRANALLPGRNPFDPDDVAKLRLGTDVDDTARKYAEIVAVLDAFERKAVFVRRDIEQRRRVFERERAMEGRDLRRSPD
jgi:hypothetical protein